MNSLNSPARLSTVIAPLCCWVMMSQLIDRPSPVPSPVGLVVKKRLKQFVPDLGWDAGAIVADANFHSITEIAGAHLKQRPEVRPGAVMLLLAGGVDAVTDEVQ